MDNENNMKGCMHKMKCDINSQFVMLVVVLVTQIAEMKFSVSSIKAMFFNRANSSHFYGLKIVVLKF